MSLRIPITALLIAAMMVATPVHALRAGDKVPAISLGGADAQAIELAQLRGNVVYVDFWASWCGPCRRSFPWMNALHARYANQGLTIVGINVDKQRGDADRFLRDVPAAFKLAFDPQGAAPAAFGVKGMPSSYLIDRDGVVDLVEEGFHDEHRNAIEARIRALLAKP
jgi:thiol-disulfide isomerase/thioredoxin